MLPPQCWYIHTYTHTPLRYKPLCKYFTHIYTEEDVDEEESAKPERAGYFPWIASVTANSRCSLVSAKKKSRSWCRLVQPPWPVRRLCVLVLCFLSFCALVSLALQHCTYKSTSQGLFGRKIFLRRSRHLGFQVGCGCILWSLRQSYSAWLTPKYCWELNNFF